MQKYKALFLDRDGVINEDTGYAHKPEHIVFTPGIFEVCRSAYAQAYRLIVVTNQSGIGRGLYTEDDFQSLMRWMAARFASESCPLTAWYFCPHHPEHGIGVYKQDCTCRKPKPGMILHAAQDWDIDLAHSMLVGDHDRDIAAGRAAKVGICKKFPPLCKI